MGVSHLFVTSKDENGGFLKEAMGDRRKLVQEREGKKVY